MEGVFAQHRVTIISALECFVLRYHNVMMKMKRIILAAAGHFSTQFDYDEVIKFNMSFVHLFGVA